MQKLKEIVYPNLANVLTGLRIIFIFPLILYTDMMLQGLNGKWLNYIGCLLIICVSDLLDGKVARRLKIAGEFGATFDVVADVFFVFLAHAQLIGYHILPAWFLLIMAEKIGNYLITSRIISKRSNGKFTFIRDPLGRLVSASYFMTPFVIMLGYYLGAAYVKLAYAFICMLSVMGIVSSIYRDIQVWKIVMQYRLETLR